MADDIKIAIVGTQGVPARYGGFETLAENLLDLKNHGAFITVYCSGKVYDKSERSVNYKGARLRYIHLNANGKTSIAYDLICLTHACATNDKVILLGASAAPFLPLFKVFFGNKIIVNTDGLEWSRQKWGKIARYYLKLSEWCILRFSHSVIADNMAIKEYYQVKHGVDSEFIAYGGDQPREYRPYSNLRTRKKNYAVNVSRTVPENNLHLILESFSLQARFDLVIFGDWEGSDYGKTLYARFHEFDQIVMLPPMYNDEAHKNWIRKNATMYVHGHGAGGTSPGLVEAMSMGLPIISFDVSFNRATTHGHAEFFETTEDLIHILTSTEMGRFDVLSRLSLKTAKEHYRWNDIVLQYLALARK